MATPTSQNPPTHMFFTNCDLVKRNFQELRYLENLDFEYIVDTETGKRISVGEMQEIMHTESVQASHYGNYNNTDPQNHYHNNFNNDPSSPNVLTSIPKFPPRPLMLMIYDTTRLGRKGRPVVTPQELLDHQCMLFGKIEQGTDFTREIETLKANLFNTNDDRRYKQNSLALAEEIKNVDQEILQLIQGKQHVLHSLENLLSLISVEASKFQNTNQQLKDSLKTYDLPQTADLFNDTQLTINLLENIPIDDGDVVNSLLNYLNEKLFTEQFYPAPIGEIPDYFNKWHMAACGYNKNNVVDLIGRDLWGGIQERLKIPLSCSMENAVEQNLRHIRANLERFGKWGVRQSKVKLEVQDESENSILDTFKMQIDLYKSIKSVNNLASVDKIYEKQKSMLENHELILQCASEFRDLSVDLYKQVDLIIEFYTFLDSAYEENSRLERARNEYDFIMRGHSFFQSLLSYPQVLLTSALVPENKRAHVLNYCNMPNCLKILFTGNSGSSEFESSKTEKIHSRRIFQSVSETVASLNMNSDFGDGLLALLPKEFQIEATKQFATSTSAPTTVDTSCCTSLHVQNKQIQTVSDVADGMCQVQGVFAKITKLGIDTFDITTAQGNANDASCQTSLSKHHSPQIIQVIPISTETVQKTSLKTIINADQQRDTSKSRKTSEQTHKLPPIRFSKFRIDDIVYIFPAESIGIYELLQDNRQSSARYFVEKIMPENGKSNYSLDNGVMSSSTKSLSSKNSNSLDQVPQLAKIVNIRRCEVKKVDNRYGINGIGDIFYLVDIVLLEI